VRGLKVVSSKSGDLENHYYSMPNVAFTHVIQPSLYSEAALSISAALQPPQYSKTFCLKLVHKLREKQDFYNEYSLYLLGGSP
jgi:hypothetical protein